MGLRDQVVIIANGEADVTWADYTDNILDYFRVATARIWTREEARKISWCTYFAYWVLAKAGVQPLPQAGTPDGLKNVGGSVGRFLKYSTDAALKGAGHTGNGVYPFYSVASKSYAPQPGDLYYMPKHNNHVGVIVGVVGHQIWTVDGNAGPAGWDKRFYISYANGKPVKRIGDGFVYKPGAPKTLGVNDFYIKIPD